MSRGDHRSDPISSLISEEGPWYSPRGRDPLAPGLFTDTAPLPPPELRPPEPRSKHYDGRHRKVRKLRPRYVFAATFTALLAVPSLWMASYIASGYRAPDPPPANRVAHIPMELISGQRAEKQICVYIANTGTSWRAWASDSSC